MKVCPWSDPWGRPEGWLPPGFKPGERPPGSLGFPVSGPMSGTGVFIGEGESLSPFGYTYTPLPGLGFAGATASRKSEALQRELEKEKGEEIMAPEAEKPAIVDEPRKKTWQEMTVESRAQGAAKAIEEYRRTGVLGLLERQPRS